MFGLHYAQAYLRWCEQAKDLVLKRAAREPERKAKRARGS